MESFEQFHEKADIIANRDQPEDAVQEANQAILQLLKEDKKTLVIYSAQLITMPNATTEQVEIGTNFISRAFTITRFHSIDNIIDYWALIPEDQQNLLKQILLHQIISPKEELSRSSISILSLIISFIYPTGWPDFYDNLQNLQHEFKETSTLRILQLLYETYKYNFIRPRYIAKIKEVIQYITTLTFQILREKSEESEKEASILLLTNLMKYSINFKRSPDILETTSELLLQNFSINNARLHDLIYNFFYILIDSKYDKLPQNLIMNLAQVIDEKIQSQDENIKKATLLFIKKLFKLSSINEELKPSIDHLYSEKLIVNILQLLPYIGDSFVFEGKDESLGYYAYKALRSISLFDKENPTFSMITNFFNSKKADRNVKVRCSSILALKSCVNDRDDYGQFIQSINGDLMSFSSDENLIVRQHLYSFIAKHVKYSYFYIDPKENIKFILNFAGELLKLEVKSALFGCKIISNCNLNFDSNIEEEDLLSILSIFSMQFDRPNLNELQFKKSFFSAFKHLMEKINNPSNQHLIYQFCVDCSQKNLEFVNSNEKLSFSIMISSYCAFYMRAYFNNTNFSLLEELLDFNLSLLPKINEIDNVFSSIGTIIITNPQFFRNKDIDQLMNYLVSSQDSNNDELISDSAIVIGDLFRSDIEKVNEYTNIFCTKIIKNIKNDDLNNKVINILLLTLGDIFMKGKLEDLTNHRDDAINIIKNLNNYRSNRYDEEDNKQLSLILDGSIYLSGRIIFKFGFDQEFIQNRDIINILLDFRNKINIRDIDYKEIGFSLILCISDIVKNSSTKITFDIMINHVNIKKQIKLIAEKSTNQSLRNQARKLLSIL